MRACHDGKKKRKANEDVSEARLACAFSADSSETRDDQFLIRLRCLFKHPESKTVSIRSCGLPKSGVGRRLDGIASETDVSTLRNRFDRAFRTSLRGSRSKVRGGNDRRGEMSFEMGR